jgi:hypothetical protein
MAPSGTSLDARLGYPSRCWTVSVAEQPSAGQGVVERHGSDLGLDADRARDRRVDRLARARMRCVGTLLPTRGGRPYPTSCSIAAAFQHTLRNDFATELPDVNRL